MIDAGLTGLGVAIAAWLAITGIIIIVSRTNQRKPPKTTVIDRAIAGKIKIDDLPKAIEKAVDDWRVSTHGISLAEWLGMTESEYEIWISYPDSIADILKYRRLAPNTNLLKDRYPLARTNRPETKLKTI